MPVQTGIQILQSCFVTWHIAVECSKEFADYHKNGRRISIGNSGSQSVDGFLPSIKACQLIQNKTNQNNQRWTGGKSTSQEFCRQHRSQEIMTAWQTCIQPCCNDMDTECERN